ncbi:MAG: trypsin-like peptidase domain-containing protein [Actinomycetota bacterium]|nr:trypsin-like peptidase domain-containing protein [Actinomycetota bacterium]
MWRTALTSFVSAIVGGLLVFFIMSSTLPVGQDKSVKQTVQVPVRSETPSSSATGLTASEVYKRFAPGVVHVRAVFSEERSDFFGFWIEPQQRVADGSGFIVDGSGLIVTNAHVVQDSNSKADKITVLLSDNMEVEAKLLGTDPSTDIALLKIDPGKRNLKVLELGDSSKLEVGDRVYAIGSPFELDGTLTEGIVSALNRTIDSPKPPFKIRGAIQTDAAVNPGNSGGPLLNASGEVVGVNSQIATRSGDFAGIAFAIPSNTVKEVIDQIKKSGRASHAWIGISGMQLDKEIASVLKLPVDTGVVVVQVQPGSPADKAGLKGSSKSLINSETGEQYPIGGDIITKIGNAKVSSMDDILNFVESHKVGDRVKIEIYRGSQKKTIDLVLGERP